MDSANFTPLTCSEVAQYLVRDNGGNETNCSKIRKIILVDIRPCAQHYSEHIVHSENVNFSSILLRRLLKGIVLLSSILQYDKTLYDRLRDSEEWLVLYDSSSTSDSIRTDLIKHGNIMLKNRQPDNKVYFIDG